MTIMIIMNKREIITYEVIFVTRRETEINVEAITEYKKCITLIRKLLKLFHLFHLFLILIHVLILLP